MCFNPIEVLSSVLLIVVCEAGLSANLLSKYLAMPAPGIPTTAAASAAPANTFPNPFDGG